MSAIADPADRFARVRDFIRRGLVDQYIPSITVAAAQHGQVVWEESFGWADREARVLATPHTMYAMASITKPITATAIMVLKERGAIDLDRPINEYLGDAPITVRVGDPAGATVRRVLNHTAGLPLHYQFAYADEPFQVPPLAETIRRYGNAVTAPGERFNYSNLGYGILGAVIERCSGMAYADFVRREVFLPLGMQRSSVGIGPRLEAYRAVAYGHDGVPYPPYVSDTPAASDIFCSAHDLLRFGMMHLKAHLPDQAVILVDTTIDEMQVSTTRSNEIPGAPGWYGLGWQIKEDDLGYRSVRHEGGMMGASTVLLMIPSEAVAVAMVSNIGWRTGPNRVNAYSVAERVLATLIPTYGERLAARGDLADERAAPPPFSPAPALLGEWRGAVHTHVGPRTLALWFKDSGDIHAQIDPHPLLARPPKTLVNEATFEAGQLSGRFLGTLDTPDTRWYHQYLDLDLRLRGNVLNGAVVAYADYWDKDGGAAPGRRGGNALSFWTTLEKLR